jgi:glutamate transport system substrate-binding protein
MRRSVYLLTLLLLTILVGQVLAAGMQPTAPAQPAPTLVPPTPVPRPPTGDTELLPSESAVARIQATGTVRVGLLFNALPFGELNIRGQVIGFDADLARSMAELWGVEAELIQVTRDKAASAQMLRNGQVDLLLAAQVKHREYADLFDYSDTYYLGRKAMLVRAGDGEPESVDVMVGRSVGVVVATPAADALDTWMARSGIQVNKQTFLTLDQAYNALLGGEIDAVVDSEHRLRQVSLRQADLTRTLPEAIELEPYAVAVLRQDSSMRDLVNRTLQYLTVNGRMFEIHDAYFPGQSYEQIHIWDDLGEDPPDLAQYPTELLFPDRFVLGRLTADNTLRVAGLIGVTADSTAPESQRRLDSFHRDLIEAMAGRWGMSVEYVPNSTENAVGLVASGEADLAVGIAPDWALADRVDFSSAYLRHGERLMIRVAEEDDIDGFGSLANETILTPNNEPGILEYAVTIADENGWVIDVLQQREADLAFLLLGGEEETEVEAVFGSSFKLVPHVQANAEQLTLTLNDNGMPRWYAPSNLPEATVGQEFGYRVMTLALPDNDVDFRLLVEYTLQELARDGTLARLLPQVMLANEIPSFEIWPGPSRYLNFSLSNHKHIR